MNQIVIGLDLGATTLRSGAFTPLGELLDIRQTEIHASEGPAAGFKRMTALIEKQIADLDDHALAGIGVGATGPTDSTRGLILNPFTLPGWNEVPIVAWLEAHFRMPACLENDADVAALGEYWHGAGSRQPGEPPVRRLYAITVGTGIGTAFILDGQIYRGADGYHPEGGHQIVDPGGPLCYCGARGCWESLSSGSAIARAASDALMTESNPIHEASRLMDLIDGDLTRLDARQVADAARQGDVLAGQVIERAARAFAAGLVNIMMLYYPEMIVLSGGVMRSLDLFLPAIQDAIQAASRYIPSNRIRVLPAALGYYAGIYGAAYAVLQYISAPLNPRLKET